ncbi:endo arabinanase [Aspergillus fumigatus]|nr:endo arabinanase [Aspergillus fumigatus]
MNAGICHPQHPHPKVHQRPLLYHRLFRPLVQTHPLLHPVPFTPLIRTGLPPSHLTTVPLLRRPQRRQQRRQNNPQRHSHTIPAGSTFINRALPPRNSQRRPLSPFPFFPPTIPLRMLPVTQMQRALLPLNLKLKTRTEIQDADLAITEEETPPSRRVLVRV